MFLEIPLLCFAALLFGIFSGYLYAAIHDYYRLARLMEDVKRVEDETREMEDESRALENLICNPVPDND